MLPRLLPRRFPQRYSQRFPHKAPQSSPQALAQRLTAVIALAVLCGCTTTPPRTARPQAVPLPDYQQVTTPPGATPRERIVDIAMQEWRKWGQQVVHIGRDDSACVTQSPLPAPMTAGPEKASDGGDVSSQASADTENDENGREADCVRFPDGTGMEATPRVHTRHASWLVLFDGFVGLHGPATAVGSGVAHDTPHPGPCKRHLVPQAQRVPACDC